MESFHRFSVGKILKLSQILHHHCLGRYKIWVGSGVEFVVEIDWGIEREIVVVDGPESGENENEIEFVAVVVVEVEEKEGCYLNLQVDVDDDVSNVLLQLRN